MSYKVSDIVAFLESIAPPRLKMQWDNVGLLCGDADAGVTCALLALDITDAVAEEAQSCGANLIISHHPLVFRPLASVTAQGAGSLVWRLAKSGISAVCMHTNLDAASGGVNDALAAALSLSQVSGFAAVSREAYYKVTVFVPEEHAVSVREAMSAAGAGNLMGYSGCAFMAKGKGSFLPGEGTNPAVGQPGVYEELTELRLEMLCPKERLHAVVAAMRETHPYEVPAYDVFENLAPDSPLFLGRIGRLSSMMTSQELATYVCERLGCAGVRMSAGKGGIRRVAVIGGAGSEHLREAADAADAFVTGEVKYHEFLEAQRLGVTLIEAGHYHTERPVLAHLCAAVKKAFPRLSCSVAERCAPAYSIVCAPCGKTCKD